jgi:hypothetical protein
MATQVARQREGPVTLGAYERPLVGVTAEVIAQVAFLLEELFAGSKSAVVDDSLRERVFYCYCLFPVSWDHKIRVHCLVIKSNNA